MDTFDIATIIFERLPLFMKKMFRLLLKKRVDKWLDNSVRIEEGKVKDVYLAGKLVGNENNPSPCIYILKRYDNRLRDVLEIEKIFLRVYVNNAPLKIVTWEKIEKRYENISIKEVYTYPGEFKFRKNDEGYIHLNIFVPPYVSRDETIYISLYGYIVLKSSFGIFKKEIVDSIPVDKEKWIEN